MPLLLHSLCQHCRKQTLRSMSGKLRADRATNGNLCVLLATLIYRGVCHYDAGMCVRLRDYRVYAGICGVVDSLRRSEL